MLVRNGEVLKAVVAKNINLKIKIRSVDVNKVSISLYGNFFNFFSGLSVSNLVPKYESKWSNALVKIASCYCPFNFFFS